MPVRSGHAARRHAALIEATEARAIAEAQRDAALQVLSALVRVVDRIGGYMGHADQASLRHARALVAEGERR